MNPQDLERARNAWTYRGQLRPSARRSFCEWKGEAEYFDVEGSTGWIGNANGLFLERIMATIIQAL
ncbi:MAG: DUF427 domain-containing protein [Lamprobacter sp.]|uniref:DUF427 domain-containing protein n=1 Tax=Lamprobacter sp. TaxID=3100796 RepID=UPI002B2625FD|nr:DUF427 domain-containing protein [Lamprobacter sp.]MEA3642438.1 DUF427 domain-containing protein [Lamprobacter sp.]